MPDNPAYIPRYRGRFAPSPTGPLHLGSLVTAVGSYLEARSNHGEWLIRIENVDPTREIPGAAGEILNVLDALGMAWNGEAVFQNRRYHAYKADLARLAARHLIYPCNCTRREIADSSVNGVDGAIYAGNCRGRSLTSREDSQAWRVRTDYSTIEFEDLLQGTIRQQLAADIGDFVVRRADKVIAYQLAVVVDDAEQAISHVVRGADLLSSTPRQIYLQRLLGYSTPFYMHLPIAVNAQGQKLAKQTLAAPVDVSKPVLQLMTALRFLGQKPPAELSKGSLDSFWTWAVDNWERDAVPRVKSQGF